MGPRAGEHEDPIGQVSLDQCTSSSGDAGSTSAWVMPVSRVPAARGRPALRSALQGEGVRGQARPGPVYRPVYRPVFRPVCLRGAVW